MLGRRLGVYQWLSLLILMAGVALVQVWYSFLSVYYLGPAREFLLGPEAFTHFYLLKEGFTNINPGSRIHNRKS